MARINKAHLTKLEIIQVACELFLEQGYTNTSAKALCNELGMSTGNLTFYYPTKEHLLNVLTKMLCDFQWHLMEVEANEGVSSLLAVCLKQVAMSAICEDSEVARDLYLSMYTLPMCLETIRKNEVVRAKEVFGQYCPDWTDEDYNEAEVLVSGIEYAGLMTTENSPPLPVRLRGSLDAIMKVYNIPEELREIKIEKAMKNDALKLGRRIFNEFRQYVEEVNERTMEDLFLNK